jgi:hypothetical protein
VNPAIVKIDRVFGHAFSELSDAQRKWDYLLTPQDHYLEKESEEAGESL